MKNKNNQIKPGVILCADSYYLKVDDLFLLFSIPEKVVRLVVRESLNDLLICMENLAWINYDDLPLQIREMRSFPTKTDLYKMYRLNGSKATFLEHVISMIKDELITAAIQSHKHSLHFIKRTYGAKDFPVLKACRSFAVFELLSQHRMLTIPIKFLLYLSVANEEFLFVTRSQNTFQMKFSRFLKFGIDTFIHRNFQNANAMKVTDKDLKAILAYYQKGERLSLNEIVRKLNTLKVARGDEQRLSRSTVRRHLLNSPNYGVATLARDGSEGIANVLSHFRRDPPHFAGDLYQIDGTRFNVLYQDEFGKVSFLCMVVAIDVYSKKVVGYSLSPRKSFANYIDCIKMSVKAGNFLPAEILTDNFSSSQNANYDRLVKTLFKLGSSIEKHKHHQPQAKGNVENWFQIFGDMYLKEVKGYLGDGVKCHRKDGKPNSDMIVEARKKKNIRMEAELVVVFAEAIVKYNSTYAFKNSTPNNLYAGSYPKNVIHLDEHIFPLVMLEYGTRQITCNRIDIFKDGVIYQYRIRDKDFILKYLKKTVVIRYDKFDHQEVLVYELDGLSILLKLKVHKKLVQAKVNRTPENDIELYEYVRDRNSLEQELKEEVKAFKQLINQVPIAAVHYKIDSKELIHDAEDAQIQSELKIPDYAKPIDQAKKVNADTRRKTVKVKSFSKDVKTIVGLKESPEKLILSFNDMFKVKGSIKLLD